MNTFRTLRKFEEPRKKRKQDIKQWMRSTSSFASATSGNKSQKRQTKVVPSPEVPSLSKTIIVPQFYCCSHSSIFTSITISAKEIPSPLKQPCQIPSCSSVISPVKNDKASSNSPVPLSCRATMVKVTEYRKRYEADQKNKFSLSVPKQPTFTSSVHLEILSSQSASSTFYLYKLLCIPLCVSQHNKHSVHKSSLFLSIRKLQFSSLEKLDATRHLLEPSERNIRGCVVTVKKIHHTGITIVKSRTSRGDTSFDSMVQLANLSPLPFRAGHHSSLEAVKENEKANDISGTLWSNQRGQVEDPAQELVVFFHLLKNCTCGYNSTDKLQILSLKEALQLYRPDFILRSQRRVHRLEQRKGERRGLKPIDSTRLLQTTKRRQNCTKTHPFSDNLFKPKDRAISGKEMQLRSRRIYNQLPEVIKKKEVERRRLVLQTNRLRAEVFKKKLLEQILQRNSD